MIDLGINLAKGAYQFSCFIKDIYCAVSEVGDCVAEVKSSAETSWAFLDMVKEHSEIGKFYLANRQHCSQLV